MKCFCCGNDDILRDKEKMKQFQLCDYWYCQQCIIDQQEDILNILNEINESDQNMNNHWIVQVYWNNEEQWKSAKILSVDLKNNDKNMEMEEGDDIEQNENNQITIIYLENEMEDIINIDDKDMILRFIANRIETKPCTILVCCTLFRFISYCNA